MKCVDLRYLEVELIGLLRKKMCVEGQREVYDGYEEKNSINGDFQVLVLIFGWFY